MSDVAGLVGVYHADGGVRGELSYAVGHLLGTAHCALCDITHGPLRRKPAWDAMVLRLAVPVELVHRNELPADLLSLVATVGTPMVAVRRTDGSVASLLGPGDLQLDGSIEAIESALLAALGPRISG